VSTGVRFAVETWAPEYGSPTDAVALTASDETVDATVEVPLADWSPRTPPPGSAVTTPDAVAFVDGVRRVDARVWVTGQDGAVRQGICASWAAGVVRCCGPEARLAGAEVRRSLFTPGAAESVATRHGSWSHRPAADDDPDQLAIALQNAMADLEHRVSERAGGTAAAPDLLLVDGPLRERARIAGAVGYVKTHQRSYLPADAVGIIGTVAAGQRTPVLHIGGRFSRWSWYARLPGEVGHPWAGIVRCEASTAVPPGEVVALADRVTATLPRFASVPQKDPRAPQNLHPIAGLERELRRRLGDPLLLYRALREASAAAAA
jgi:hypothetical protein